MRRTASCLLMAFLCARTASGQVLYPSQPPAYPGASTPSSGTLAYPNTQPYSQTPTVHSNGMGGFSQQPTQQSYPGQNSAQPVQNSLGTGPLNPFPGMPTVGPTRVQTNNSPQFTQYAGQGIGYQTPAQAAVQAAAGAPENRITFDPRQADLQWMNGHWVLMAGNTFLKDFGARENDGREALRVVQNLNLTDLGRVGAPKPVMEYWLANGQAPQPTNLGSHVLPLDPGTLRVEESMGQWHLRNNLRTLFSFHNETDARQALAIIRHYNFTHVGYVGQGAPSMLVFLSNPNDMTRDPRLVTPTPLSQRTTTPGVSRPQAAAQYPNSPITQVQYTQQGTGQSTPTGTPAITTTVQPIDLRHTPVSMAYEPSQMGGAASPGQMAGRPYNGAVPAGTGANGPTNHVAFDFRRVQAIQEGNEWKLMYGSYPLASFGTSQHDAQLALMAVQHYHFTEQVTVGHAPSLSYFLVGGQAPRGLMMGMDGVTFAPASLALQQLPSGWALCGPNGVLAQFGNDGAEAKRALEAINREKFSYLCHIGHEGTGLTFLVRSR